MQKIEDYIIGHRVVTEAFKIAKEAHNSINQKRKYSDEPYWHHPKRVAEFLLNNGFCYENNILSAALLHDVIEDVPGYDVNKLYNLIEYADIVRLAHELTNKFTENNCSFDKKTRFLLECNRLANISSDAKNIKLADIYDNISNLSLDDKVWGAKYIEYKDIVLDYLFEYNTSIIWKIVKNKIQEQKELFK